MRLVLEDEVGPDYRYFVPAMREHLPGVRVHDVVADGPPASLDGVVVAGSTAGVYEADVHEWMTEEAAFIQEHLEHEGPTLGICFDHQLVDDALGGRVEHPGLVAELVETELADVPLFDGVAPVLPAFHGDHVVEVGDSLDLSPPGHTPPPSEPAPARRRSGRSSSIPSSRGRSSRGSGRTSGGRVRPKRSIPTRVTACSRTPPGWHPGEGRRLGHRRPPNREAMGLRSRGPAMAVVRHGAGPTATLGALASQVHPVFMLPPLAAAAFGSVLAGRFEILPGGLHLAAVFLAVYTAHVKDGYVDFHGRGEDDDHPLTARGCRLALAGTTAAFTGCLVGLSLVADPVAVALTAPCWAIGYLHAPYLDMRPVTATMGYPTGIALALLGGVAIHGGSLGPAALGFAFVFVLLLSGVKVIDDANDLDYDRTIGKRTVAVVLGPRRARTLAHALMGVALVAVLALAIDGVFPPSAPAAAVAFGAVAVVAVRAPPGLATRLLVRGAYVFFAILVAAVWFRPLAGVPLPDIGVLGPYTYLATELAFGALAALLLWRADAWWSAARTIAVLYPVAYVWDWYSLEVGVFAIPLRTGIELVGIPLEEHLFMVVVPALVIGVHETLRARAPAD